MSIFLDFRNFQKNVWGSGQYLAWTESKLYRMSNTTAIALNPTDFAVGPTWSKWGIVNWHDGVFFINPYNKLRFLKGSSLVPLNETDLWFPRGGKYLEMFQDHLLVGAPNIQGTTFQHRICWSSLRDMTKWYPKDTNDADFYDLICEEELSEFNAGVTGMKRLLDFVVVYANRNVWLLRYVGNKLVAQLFARYNEIGCAFPYSVVGYSDLHVFIGEENIYSFNGEAIQIIGDPIKDYFFDNIHSNSFYRFRTWGYIDKNRGEVVWTFVSKNSANGQFDKSIIWNFRQNAWSVADSPNIHGALEVNTWSNNTVINDHNEIINTNNEIINLVDQNETFGKMFVYGTENTILRDAVDGDSDDSLFPSPEIILETKDLTYQDVFFVKENDTLFLDADYDTNTCSGIQIEYAARQSLSAPLVWVTIPTLWTKATPQGRVSFPRTHFRVIRFRFTFKKIPGKPAIRWAHFNTWSENIFFGQNSQAKLGAER